MAMTNARESKDALLYAAALLFADKGFHGTSLEDLALATGQSVESLIDAYESKEGLFYAAVELTGALLAAEERERMTSLLPRVQKAVLNSKLLIFHREAIARLSALGEEPGG
jgi:AcrR family transcriptional regulator